MYTKAIMIAATYPLTKRSFILANNSRELWPSIGVHTAIEFTTGYVMNCCHYLA